jgi:ferrous iron transport protein A
MNRSAAELSVGEAGRVGEVTGAGDITRRLLEMGITPGALIRRLGAAPLGDPLEFELRGYRLSLRRAEARFVALDEVSR